MKKILFLILCLTPLLLQAQTKMRRGMIVGDPPENMAEIDSIKIINDVLYFYVGTDTIFAALEDDLVEVDTVAHMLVDTLQFVFGAGAGNAGDTATMATDRIFGAFKTMQDSVVFDSIVAQCFGTNADITLQVQYSSSLNSGGTGIHAALNVTTAGGETGTSTFTTLAVGPGNWIWCEPTVVTAGVKPTYVVLILFYHEKRAS